MSEKPILFNTEMVKAILDGRKTQTRRVIKPQPPKEVTDIIRNGTEFVSAYPNRKAIKPFEYKAKPKYQIGDILWVRETWRVGAWDRDTGKICIDYRTGEFSDWLDVPEEMFERLWIQSTDDAGKAELKLDEEGDYNWEKGQSPCRWRPNIFMPRWAARIFRQVTNVRVERLQDIPEKDAACEGIRSTKLPRNVVMYHVADWVDPLAADNPIGAFANLWNSINEKKGHGYDKNDRVWVYDFKRKEV